MLKEVIRRVHPNPPLETPPTRFSIHPVGHLTMPSLRWWDGKTPTHHKSPLLGLKLSSKSFLNTSLEDDLSATTVYTIKTTEASTAVLRYGNENNPLDIATINWRGTASTSEAREDDNPPLIKMKDCRWSEGPVFLRSGPNPKYVHDSYHIISRFQTCLQQFFPQIHHSRLFAYYEMEALWYLILGGHISYSSLITLIESKIVYHAWHQGSYRHLRLGQGPRTHNPNGLRDLAQQE